MSQDDKVRKQQLFKSHLVDTICGNMQDQVYRNVRNLIELVKDSPKDVEFLFETFGFDPADVPEEVSTQEGLGEDLMVKIETYVFDRLNWEFDDDGWIYMPPGHVPVSGHRPNALLSIHLDPETVEEERRNLDTKVSEKIFKEIEERKKAC